MQNKVKNIKNLIDSKDELLALYQNLSNSKDSIVDLCRRLSNLQISKDEKMLLRKSILFSSCHYYHLFYEKVKHLLPHMNFSEAQIILSFISNYNLPTQIWIGQAECSIAQILVDRIIEDMQINFLFLKGEANKPVSLMSLTLLLCSTLKLRIDLNSEAYQRTQTFLNGANSSLFGYISSLNLLYQVPKNLRTAGWDKLKLFAIDGLNETFTLEMVKGLHKDNNYWQKKLCKVIKLVETEHGNQCLSNEVNNFYRNASFIGL